jgi:hypothetical protein
LDAVTASTFSVFFFGRPRFLEVVVVVTFSMTSSFLDPATAMFFFGLPRFRAGGFTKSSTLCWTPGPSSLGVVIVDATTWGVLISVPVSLEDGSTSTARSGVLCAALPSLVGFVFLGSCLPTFGNVLPILSVDNGFDSAAAVWDVSSIFLRFTGGASGASDAALLPATKGKPKEKPKLVARLRALKNALEKPCIVRPLSDSTPCSALALYMPF